ncbi:hypothetical protein MKZ38_008226 [Zalerion maritima]|uniref:Uncharacterized protein n=1 Tax=Zalerion maritima TaxID=339359 RepID=A0AAD5RHR2_9PEZI|nr:hypothetical protein MKZ38_008226 [Zalerion maritima]
MVYISAADKMPTKETANAEVPSNPPSNWPVGFPTTCFPLLHLTPELREKVFSMLVRTLCPRSNLVFGRAGQVASGPEEETGTLQRQKHTRQLHEELWGCTGGADLGFARRRERLEALAASSTGTSSSGGDNGSKYDDISDYFVLPPPRGEEQDDGNVAEARERRARKRGWKYPLSGPESNNFVYGPEGKCGVLVYSGLSTFGRAEDRIGTLEWICQGRKEDEWAEPTNLYLVCRQFLRESRMAFWKGNSLVVNLVDRRVRERWCAFIEDDGGGNGSGKRGDRKERKKAKKMTKKKQGWDGEEQQQGRRYDLPPSYDSYEQQEKEEETWIKKRENGGAQVFDSATRRSMSPSISPPIRLDAKLHILSLDIILKRMGADVSSAIDELGMMILRGSLRHLTVRFEDGVGSAWVPQSSHASNPQTQMATALTRNQVLPQSRGVSQILDPETARAAGFKKSNFPVMTMAGRDSVMRKIAKVLADPDLLRRRVMVSRRHRGEWCGLHDKPRTGGRRRGKGKDNGEVNNRNGKGQNGSVNGTGIGRERGEVNEIITGSIFGGTGTGTRMGAETEDTTSTTTGEVREEGNKTPQDEIRTADEQEQEGDGDDDSCAIMVERYVFSHVGIVTMVAGDGDGHKHHSETDDDDEKTAWLPVDWKLFVRTFGKPEECEIFRVTEGWMFSGGRGPATA